MTTENEIEIIKQLTNLTDIASRLMERVLKLENRVDRMTMESIPEHVDGLTGVLNAKIETIRRKS